MPETYTELFKIEFTGVIGELEAGITSQTGVASVSIGEQTNQEVSTTLDCEISYEMEVTNRDRVKTDLESIDGVGGVTLS